MTDHRRRLPRRTQAQTRELLLLAGTLIADEAALTNDPRHVERLFAHLTIDDVIDVAKRIQVYLLRNEDPPVDTSPLGEWLLRHTEEDRDPTPAETLGLQHWIRSHRSEILDERTDDYTDMAKTIVYSVFESEAHLHAELLRYIFSIERVSQIEILNEHLTRISRDGGTPSLTVLVSELADLSYRESIDDPARYVELGAAPYLRNEEIAATIREQYDRAAEQAVPFFSGLLESFGISLRPGLEVSDLYATLAALEYGFLFGHPIDPDTHTSMRTIDGLDRTLFAAAVEAIISGFVQEPGGEPGE